MRKRAWAVALLALPLFCWLCLSPVHAEEPAVLPEPPLPVVIGGESEAQGGYTLQKVELEDGRIIHTYVGPQTENPDDFCEAELEKGGVQYRRDVVVQTPNYTTETKLANKTVTASHKEKDGARAQFAPILDYEQDGWAGQLQLDASSIYTEAGEKKSYSYTQTETREYTGLARNDPYYVPKSVTKNGATLELADIQWTAMGDGQYKAIASYSGKAAGSKVQEYLSTASYVGEVSRKVLVDVAYQVVYEATGSVPVGSEQDGGDRPSPSSGTKTETGNGSFSPLPLSILFGVILLAAVVVLFLLRKNLKVYTEQEGVPQLALRLRLSTKEPVIDLSQYEFDQDCGQLQFVLDRFSTKLLDGQDIRILLEDGTEVRRYVQNTGAEFKFQIDLKQEREEEPE